ncbi:MAG: Fic family protein [Betaproteobacteria bacterium]
MLHKTPKLNDHERKVVDDILSIRDSLKYAISGPSRWIGVLRRNAFARNIQGSNSIEGYNITVDDAIAAVEGEQPLDAQSETWAAITGYRGAMTYVLQLSADPHFSYSDGLIRSLHFMMLSYDLSKHPGRWRPGPIFVRNEQTGKRVYEGPDAELVPQLIRELVLQLDSDPSTPFMVRAAMCHLNLVMIHPFSDGNGRMARCLQTLVLAREGIIDPWFSSIEEYLGRNTQSYYDVLALTGKGLWSPQNDARAWIHFCLTAHYRQAKTLLRRSKEMQRIWNELEEELKRLSLPSRSVLALSDAALGYRVRNATYRSAAEISEALASRDLKTLVDAGLLVPDGEKRGRAYVASDRIKEIRQRTREPRQDEDPVFSANMYLPGLEPRY